ncbi:MAG: DNA repair protein RecN [Acidobacteria bacterium]|nr:DNA repair protein RecN [Acidobacteriota bacterium]
MLTELRVRNLLLIEEAELRPAAGLNVLTGETGAGKTVLAHALDLLLGGRPRSAVIRPGADEALVEGVFELDEAEREALSGILDGDEGEVVLARRVQASGRTRALVNGRTVTVGALREAAERLLAFYGQHEHRKLTVASSQLEILDHFCGDGQRARLDACAEAHRRVLDAQERLAELEELEGGRERELDILDFEIAEIEEAAPDPAAEEELLAARSRLSNLEGLRAACAGALEALEPEDGEGAVGRIAAAEAALRELPGAVAQLDEAAGRLGAAAVDCADVARELRAFAEGLDADPGELELVESRLAAWERLKRKHGGSIEEVLRYAGEARERRDLLAGSEEATADARAALEEALADRTRAATALRRARRKAAAALSERVEERLEALAMPGASFEVMLTDREPGASGADSAEFVVAPNPGVPAGPLREIASGGELSRVMLALLGIASDGAGATLVFDEVDAGIGGKTANAVGEQLVGLAAGRQVICITHLPQVASLAARHFSIEKGGDGEGTRTTVRELAEPEVVDELVRMLGAESGDPAAAEHARRLRNAALPAEADAA